MDDYESLSHTKWECKYHVVFIPKYRRKTLYGELIMRQHLGEVFRKLAAQKECKIEEGHLMPRSCSHDDLDPTKIRRLTGDRVYGERKRNFIGQHFWARAYFVSTVGRDEAGIREYIKKQEQEDIRLDQIKSFLPRLGRRFCKIEPVGSSGQRNRSSIQGFDEC